MSILHKLDKKMPILIVDDLSTARRIAKNCLKQLGFTNLHEAPDGEAAWEKIQHEEFSLIVSDWAMPNMKGIELLKNVRSKERSKEIPFLMVTSEAQEDQILQAVQAGASNVMLKPFAVETLSEKMKAIFGD